MHPIDFVEPWYYGTVYFIFIGILCWFTALYYIGSSQQKILYSAGSPMQAIALFLALVMTFFIGLRPISGLFFGDMSMYAHTYSQLEQGIYVDFKKEWFWDDIVYYCKLLGLNVNEYFVVISAGYFLGMFICSALLMRSNLWIGMLFFLISFSCYPYGVNGIRNGMACSIELIAIALIAQNKKRMLLSLLLMFLAMGIHRTTMLPSLMAIISAYVIKDTKWALRFWVLSIFVSLAAGSLVQNFFASLGFDDRLSRYGGAEMDADTFSHTGFRFDFLFYSMWPVIWTWYVVKYRHFTDKTFHIIASTYILCNAFWIMVIRASYSNRFAYLSWFIYPLVIAYPLLRMNLWKDQDRRTAIVLFLYSGFTLFMFFIFYFGTMNGFRGFNQFWWR